MNKTKFLKKLSKLMEEHNASFYIETNDEHACLVFELEDKNGYESDFLEMDCVSRQYTSEDLDIYNSEIKSKK